MAMTLNAKVTTPPAAELLTLAEAKAWLRVDHALEDALITSLIPAAREYVENLCHRSLGVQTLTGRADDFPRDPDDGDYALELPRPPLRSVTSVQYVDVAGATVTLAADAYQVDAWGEPGRIMPAIGRGWPATRAVPNAVTVVYQAGFDALPTAARQAMLLCVAQWYDSRDAAQERALPRDVELGVQRLCRQLWHGRLYGGGA